MGGNRGDSRHHCPPKVAGLVQSWQNLREASRECLRELSAGRMHRWNKQTNKTTQQAHNNKKTQTLNIAVP